MAGESGGVQDERCCLILAMSIHFIFSNGHCLWCCLIRSRACICSAGSQVLLLFRYPFHFMRYWNFLFFPKCRWFFIISTLYSTSPFVRSGGSWEKFGPCAFVSIYGGKQTHMEYWVDISLMGKLKLICHKGYDFCDFKGAMSSWG